MEISGIGQMGGLFYVGAALLPVLTVLLLLVVARRTAGQAMPVALVVSILISIEPQI
jgi:L-lactate permease